MVRVRAQIRGRGGEVLIFENGFKGRGKECERQGSIVIKEIIGYSCLFVIHN